MFSGNAIAGEKVKFIIDVKPLSFLIADDIDGFSSSSIGGFYYASETIDGNVLWTPHLKVGIGFNAGDVVGIDFTGGAGYLAGGEVLSAPFFLADVALNFTLGRAITIGPHIGFISIDEIDWDESSDIKLSDTSGIIGGLAFTAGHEKISFSLSVDVVELDEIDVENGERWTASQSSIDLSGWMVNLGVKMKF